MSRILITGSRSWDDASFIKRALMLHGVGSRNLLVSGACPDGADRLAEIAAAQLGWGVELHPADWAKYGKRAGFLRNSAMVELGADHVLAFIRDNSRGASMTARIATEAGLDVTIYRYGDAPPRKLHLPTDETLF